MAGTLTISTLSDGTNSTSSTNCIQGSAKAWVAFNGSTTTIRASYNVGSITKNGTGDFTLNFTNAFADGNYCVTTSKGLTGNFICGVMADTTAPTASAVRINNRGASDGAYTDAAYMYFAVFR